MKKYLFILILNICMNFALFSLKTFHIESVKIVSSKHIHNEINTDMPILLVKTNISGLGFQNVNRPTKHAATFDVKKGNYYFIMNDNQRVVRITHDDYEPLEIRFLADYNINVDSGKVYKVVLTEGEINYSEVEFKITPVDAELIIDNDLIKTRKLKLQYGNYRIQIRKRGYATISKKIEIKNEIAYLDYNLSKLPKLIVQKEEIGKNDKINKHVNLTLLLILISPVFILIIVSIFKKDKFRNLMGRLGLFVIIWFIINIAIFFSIIDSRIFYVSVFNYFQLLIKNIF